MYGSHVWLCPLNSIKNEHSYGLVTKKLAGGNVEILSSWKMETMKEERSEISYKGEKQLHSWGVKKYKK